MGLVVAGLMAGCDDPSTSRTAPRNVLLIVVDTLRADHVGAYGGKPEDAEVIGRASLTPRLDRLANESVVFERALATSSWTKSSVASMLTARHPATIGVLGRNDAIDPSVVTLPEVLKANGYRTLAVSTNANAGLPYGFDQGFDRFEIPDPSLAVGYPGEPPVHGAEGVTRRAIELLENTADQEAPFFLFLHYIDPHDPYLPHPGLLDVPEPDGRFQGSRADLERMDTLPVEALTAADRARIRHLYAGEVRFCDQWLGELFDWLDTAGLDDDTMIVVTSDHGEGLWDHDKRGHGLDLFEESIHVPLIVQVPSASHRRVAEPVSLVDLASTVLAAVGIPSPSSFRGRDLLAGAADAPRSRRDRLLYAELALDGNDFDSVRDGQDKLIRNRRRERLGGLGVWRLYDLARDPDEQQRSTDQDQLARMKALLLGKREDVLAGASSGRQVAESALDAEALANLRALGYLGGAAGPPPEPAISAGLPEPQRDDAFMARPLVGFYPDEGRIYRWMAGYGRYEQIGFGVDRWALDGWVDLVRYGRPALELEVRVNGGPPQTFSVTSSGPFRIGGTVSSADGELVTIDVRCDHTFSPSNVGSQDERRLCMMVRTIGLH